MSLHLLDHQGRTVEGADRAFVESRLASGEFFWLDIREPSEDEFALLREVFRFHPLAVEDSEHFGQRPKFEDYGDVVFLVLYRGRARAGRGSARRGALLLLRALPGHRPARRGSRL